MSDYKTEGKDKRLDRLTSRHIAKSLSQLGESLPAVVKGSIKHSLWALNNEVHDVLLEEDTKISFDERGLSPDGKTELDILEELRDKHFEECMTNVGSLAPPAAKLSIERSFRFLEEDITVQVLDYEIEETIWTRS